MAGASGERKSEGAIREKAIGKRAIGKKGNRGIAAVSVLLAAAVLFFAVWYALVRDSSNGVNKLMVTAGGTSVACLGDGVTQELYLTHDFNGISLRLDHNRAASFGRLCVTVCNAASGETVLTSRVPLWTVDPDRDVFFSTEDNRRIAVSEAGKYVVHVSYEGPACGYVVLQTGGAEELQPSACVPAGFVTAEGEEQEGQYLSMGLLTDVCRYRSDAVLTALAGVLLSLGILAAGHTVCRCRSAAPGKEISVRFLAAYGLLVTGIFVLSLTYTEVTSYEGAALGGDAKSGREEVKDTRALDAFLLLKDADVCGIDLGGVNLEDRVLTDEAVRYQLRESGTNRVLQTGELRLSELREDSVYLMLDDRYNAGTRLALHLEGHGLTYQGVRFDVSEQSVHGEDSLYIGGEPSDLHLCGTIFHAVHERSYAREITFYAAFLLFGAVLAYLLLVRGMPLLPAGGEGESGAYRTGQGFRRTLRAGRRKADPESGAGRLLPGTLVRKDRRRELLGFLALVLFCAAVGDYGWGTSIAAARNLLSAEIASYAGEGKEWVTLPQTEQHFTVSENRLAGVAVEIAEQPFDGAGVDNIGNIEFRAVVRDGAGEVVSDAVYKVEELETVDRILGREQNDINIELRKEAYYYLPFESVLPTSAGKEYTITLTSDWDRFERMLLASAAESDGGALNLMLMYHSYDALAVMYLTVIAVFSILLCILYLVTLREGVSPLRLYVAAALTAGLFLSILIPPHCVPDESMHINTAYWYSNQLCGVYSSAGPGRILVRSTDYVTYDVTFGAVLSFAKYREIWQGLGRGAGAFTYVPESYTNIASRASIWTFLPALTGLQLVRSLGGNMITMVMAARWCNLLAAVGMIAAGIRKCPTGKRALITVGLFPTLVQQIASCSYDAMILAFAMLFLGYEMYLITERPHCGTDYLICMVSGFLLLLNKDGTYLPLLRMLFLLPGLRHLRRKILYGILLPLAALGAGTVTFLWLNPELLDVLSGYAVEGMYSASYFRWHPDMLLHILEETAVYGGESMLRTATADGLGLLQVSIPAYVIAAIYVILYRSVQVRDQDEAYCSRRRSLFGGAVITFGVIVIFCGFLFSVTNTGNIFISGIQGRYFLPYYGLLAAVLPGLVRERRMERPNRLILFLGMVYLFAFVKIFKTFFGYVYWGTGY